MLNSLYEKAIAKRGFFHDIDSDTDVESQLEYNWFNRFIDESNDDFTIAAYPIAQNTINGSWIKSGEKFRLDISRFNADDDVKQIFEDLASGKITLADLRKYFWYTYKDEYRLGLISYAEYSKHEY